MAVGVPQVHRHEYLGSVLWWDETTLDHRLYHEDADDWQQHHLRNAGGEDCGYRQTRDRPRDFHPWERGAVMEPTKATVEKTGISSPPLTVRTHMMLTEPVSMRTVSRRDLLRC